MRLEHETRSKECFDGRVSPDEFKRHSATIVETLPVFSQVGDDKFGQRVHTQMNQLFNPVMVDPNNPKYSSLRERLPSLFRQAIRLEAADRIGDWSIPRECFGEHLP